MNPLDGSAGVRGLRVADHALLDDQAVMEAADPGQMLRATASAGAQVRESAALAAEADFRPLIDEGRPRAVVVAGVGTAARTGDVLETVAGPRCPVPVLSHRSAGIPGWVGAADLVADGLVDLLARPAAGGEEIGEVGDAGGEAFLEQAFGVGAHQRLHTRPDGFIGAAAAQIMIGRFRAGHSAQQTVLRAAQITMRQQYGAAARTDRQRRDGRLDRGPRQ